MRRPLLLGVLVAIAAIVSPRALRAEQATAGRAVEIRSYNLKPGTRDRFHQLFLKEALPMLQRWKVDVEIGRASCRVRV